MGPQTFFNLLLEGKKKERGKREINQIRIEKGDSKKICHPLLRVNFQIPGYTGYKNDIHKYNTMAPR